MRAALRRGDEVDIAFGDGLAALWKPRHSPVHHFLGPLHAPHKEFLRQHRCALQGFQEIRLEALAVAPLETLAGVFVAEAYAQSWAEHRLGAQHMAQAWHCKLWGLKVGWIGPKAYRGAGV